MIKVLIVDDEAIARINLRCLVNWEREGYIICGEADNGYDALKKVQELSPDIIFADMNMPGMNGVEFIKEVIKILPSIRILAFSSFDEFEFVRQSLKEGAVDYLVKHKIDTKSLLSILKSEKETIKKELVKTQKMNRIMAMASSGRALVQKNVIMNLLNGYIEENFEQIMKEYDISLDDRNLIISVAQIDSFYQYREKFTTQEFAGFLQTIENIFQNICSEIGKTVYVHMEDGKFVFIMSFADTASESHINSRSVANVCKIKDTVKRFLNITMSFGISNICPSFAKISEYYIETTTILENGYYKGSNYISKKNEFANNDSSNNLAGLTISEEKEIIINIRGLHREKVIELIESIFNNLKEKKVSFDTIKIVSIEFINILKRMIKELDMEQESEYHFSGNLYEDIKIYRTIDELMEWFKLLYSSLLDIIEKNKKNDNFSAVVKKAVDYILKNYYKDISLSYVSEQINVSPQYLSKLFKEENGKSFTSYLNNLRIDHAKTMMKEGIELKEVAHKVGFNNYTYFFTVFKEITGMTPQQYEKKISI